MRVTWFTFLILLLPSIACAQHLPNFAQFSDNLMLINPATLNSQFRLAEFDPAISENYVHNIGVTYKDEWAQLGWIRPISYVLRYDLLAYHNESTYFGDPSSSVALGAALLHSQEDKFRSTSAQLRASYRIGNGRYFVTGGLTGTMNWQTFDVSRIEKEYLPDSTSSSLRSGIADENNFIGIQAGINMEYLTQTASFNLGVAYNPTGQTFKNEAKPFDYSSHLHLNFGYLQRIRKSMVEGLVWVRLIPGRTPEGNANLRYGFFLGKDSPHYFWLGIGGNYYFKRNGSFEWGDAFFEPSILLNLYDSMQIKLGFAIGVLPDRNVSKTGNTAEFNGNYGFGDAYISGY